MSARHTVCSVAGPVEDFDSWVLGERTRVLEDLLAEADEVGVEENVVEID